VLAFDMGGTTTDVCLITDGVPETARQRKLGDYPVRLPAVAVESIGAGGGSIAWVDPGGALRVGPHSAGADPAPVCYGQGGTEPTITDANLVLHRIDPDHFLGGEMRLDEGAAYRAIKEKCADPLGLDVVEVALGIVEIANTAMVNAVRRISVQRGYDPRDFVLVAFGGAGPLHANRLAVELEIPTVLVPMSPGTTSAMGLLVTDLKHDYSTTVIQRADRLDVEMVNRLYREMEVQGREALLTEGMGHASIGFERQVDMRYVGQSYELSIPLDGDEIEEALGRVLQRFHEEHERAYGFAAPGEPVEFVTLRLTAVGSIAKPKLRELAERSGNVTPRAVRQVYFAEGGGFVDCPSYNRYRLAAGGLIEGPAIVEEMDSTTLIHPGFRAEVDRYGNLLIRIK
jgi:N-methylhydantoinase A